MRELDDGVGCRWLVVRESKKRELGRHFYESKKTSD